MRRIVLPLTLIAAVGLLAGCGGGDDKTTESGAAQAQSGAAASTPAAAGASVAEAGTAPGVSGDAAGVLAGVATASQTGPTKIGLSVTVEPEGTPTDPQLSAFLSEPITMNLSGNADATAKTFDLAMSIKAGPLALDGKLLSDGTNSWLQFANQWYALPADALSSVAGAGAGSTGTTPDAASLLSAFGDPAEYFTGATVVGDEDVEGIEATHVSGDIDVAKLLQTVAGIGAATGSAAVSPEEITKLEAQIAEVVSSAKADAWIGKESKQLNRATLALALKIPAEQTADYGLTGAKVTVDVTGVPGEAFTVSAPADARPLSELSGSLGSQFGGMLGGGSTTG